MLKTADSSNQRAEATDHRPASILISGLCSAGKSSFVSALWGDAELVPTAVRDCTQTNSLVRVPHISEHDRVLYVRFLMRERALEYALGDLSFYRLAGLVHDTLGPLGPRLDEGPPEQRLRACLDAVKQIFQERPDIAVLQEPLSDEIEKLEQFLSFLASTAFKPGETVELDWARRREELMGCRRPDGRTIEVGHLLAYRHVELVRDSKAWKTWSSAPVLIDSPWIPTFHNARRADLILEQAKTADLLVIVALPERFEPEPWVAEAFKRRPELRKRTLLVFNQIDTVDVTALFSRGGLAEIYAENVAILRETGIAEENIFMSCARLPFLRLCAQDEFIRERTAKLETVLARIRKQCELRKESVFLCKLLAACAAVDAGLETIRLRLLEIAGTKS